MKIGLFGGSFNPIHNVHIKICKKILEDRLLDEVWIVPCKKHAFDKDLADAKYRVDMINLAISKIQNAKICDTELKSDEKSYTLNTLRKLKKQYPSNEFFLVIGSDILYEIDKWNDYKNLLNETEFLVFKREGYEIKKVEGMNVKKILDCSTADLSSTEIRERRRKEKSICGLVPKEVEEYIYNNNLYK